MNNLYEFGGMCDVVIKCNSERKIGNKTYAAGEPYTILKDVFVNIGYRNTTSEASAKNNIAAHRSGMPDLVNLSNLTLTTKVCDLIATRVQPQTITKYYTAIGEDGVIYLPETFVSNSTYVYNRNERFVDYSENEDRLTGQFVEGGEYLIFYSVLVDNTYYDFNVPSYGYFTLDIIGKGNLDKKTKNVYIHLPAVSLISTPVFDLINGNILNTPLQFECIHRGQSNSYFVVGD